MWDDNQSATIQEEGQMKKPDFPKTELDFKYLWKCRECKFESFYMYLADTHQCKTDHLMKRIEV